MKKEIFQWSLLGFLAVCLVGVISVLMMQNQQSVPAPTRVSLPSTRVQAPVEQAQAPAPLLPVVVPPAVVPTISTSTPEAAAPVPGMKDVIALEPTDALKKMYVGNTSKLDAIDTVLSTKGILITKYGMAQKVVQRPEMIKLFSEVAGDKANDIRASFGVTSPDQTVEFTYDNAYEVLMFKGCMPHDCMQEAVGIYIPNYYDAKTGDFVDKLFIAWKADKIYLYGVSGTDEMSQSFKDILLYFLLNEQK